MMMIQRMWTKSQLNLHTCGHEEDLHSHLGFRDYPTTTATALIALLDCVLDNV